MPRGHPDPADRAARGGTSLGSVPLTGSDTPRFDVVSYPSDTKPVLLMVVDCEEEFDWDNPVRGAAYTLESMLCLGPLQAVLAACRTRDFRSITTAVRLRRRGHQTAGGAPITS